MSALTKSEYESLLKRIQDKISAKKTDTGERFELPSPDVMWEGQRTILRNFMDFAKKLRRDPDKVLQYLARYIFRVAIANSRLERIEDGHVTFRYRDNRTRRPRTHI